MKISMEEIQDRVYALGEKIDAPKDILLVRSVPDTDGTPYVSFEMNKFNYIYSERGVEFSRKTTSSLDELLYWIMYRVIFRISSKYELNNRIKGKDSRRIIFDKVKELMEKIDAKWLERANAEIDETLKRSPYVDK